MQILHKVYKNVKNAKKFSNKWVLNAFSAYLLKYYLKKYYSVVHINLTTEYNKLSLTYNIYIYIYYLPNSLHSLAMIVLR